MRKAGVRNFFVAVAALLLGVSAVAQTAYAADDTLYWNEVLYPNQRVTASGCFYRMNMQSDGNLVIYQGTGNSTAMWASGTVNRGGYAIMQTDGNFVVYNWSGGAVWSSGTNGNSFAHMTMQSDGNAVVYNWSGNAVWASQTAGESIGTTYCRWPGSSTAFKPGIDLRGSDYTHFTVSPATPHSCGYFCAQDANCKAWSWVQNGSMCWLKNAVPSGTASSGVTSGVILN